MQCPNWTVWSSRRSLVRRRRTLLLSAQTQPETLGEWLQNYRERSGDDGFTGLVIVEQAMPGLEPIEGADPHSFIEMYREALRDLRRV